ncbi:hypothetical protein CI238_05122 [Colletotrichum incanum]|uniref:Uncharacterized protein n=1 Tax=Colletotrichum incanum TaxID=1573173 RepID=A0A161W3K1_COLIC|nr:hypothetical protein CI238_05122 [Colletotrichum incanum]
MHTLASLGTALAWEQRVIAYRSHRPLVPRNAVRGNRRLVLLFTLAHVSLAANFDEKNGT